MKNRVPLLLSINGGYMDTAGFVSLHGLFTAHVTGNFVTIGAALVFGTSGVVAKLLALPVFCVTVALVHWLGRALSARMPAQPRLMLGLELLLLLGGGGLAIVLGPFQDADSRFAILTGLILVCGMAVQNAMHRLHLAKFPPTTLMTGNSTQVMLDLVDMLYDRQDPVERAATRTRVVNLAISLVAFAVGCAAAALLFAFAGMGCFVVPPLLVLAALWLEPKDRAAA